MAGDAHAHGWSDRLDPEVLGALGALSRVARALTAAGGLADVAGRALAEMRDALALDLAALYLPDPGGRPALRRAATCAAAGVRTRARAELAFDLEAWRLAVASGFPLVFHEPAGWLGEHPFDPPSGAWLVLPLRADASMVGVVVAASQAPVVLDPVRATVLTLLGDQLSAGIATASLRERLQRAEIERERMRIAAEVHDGLAQDLAVAVRELALLDEAAAGGPAARASRERLRAALTAANRTVRARLEDLHVTVPVGGLRAAVEAVCERFRARGLAVQAAVAGTGPEVPAETTAVIVRVLTEALANVEKHAGDPAVEVALRLEDQRVELLVCDSGRGLGGDGPGGPGEGRFGLTIMRSRAQAAGGVVDVESRPEGGTRVRLQLPVTPRDLGGLVHAR